MKNISSFVYLKKNTPFFQDLSVFKTCVQKNELNVRSFQNFTALLPFQFLKSSFQKKQKHLSMSSTLFLTKKMKKTKDFCFFILFEFFFLCGTYAEKLQCFDKLFFPHFFSLFVQKRVLEIEKNEHTSKRSFLVSVISFFFFFLFEKQVHSFPKKRSQKTLSLTHVPDLIWKRFFLKSLFFFFESVFKHFHTFLSSFFCLSKKKDFFKVFLKHFQFWSSFPDLSVVFPFLSRGFPSSFSYPVFRQKCEISEDQTKKTVLHSFFCLFSEQKPHIESFFSSF